VIEALGRLGFGRVLVTEPWEQALRQASSDYARETPPLRPVISPACPAVVNLIETRFPALIANLAPYLTPTEALRADLTGQKVIVMAPCPSQKTMLTNGGLPPGMEVIVPALLRTAILPLVQGRGGAEEQVSVAEAGASHDERGLGQGFLAVSGIRHVLNVLEQVENGLMGDFAMLELSACEQGCFGSPLFTEDPFTARRRWVQTGGMGQFEACSHPRSQPFAPRTGLRLDSNMARAIDKLSRIDKLAKSLPGRDCSMCGAPTCACLAEDVVLGRTEIKACKFLSSDDGKAP
jgi:hypothetical protein